MAAPSPSSDQTLSRGRRWMMRTIVFGLTLLAFLGFELLIGATGWGLPQRIKSVNWTPVGMPMYKCESVGRGGQTCAVSDYFHAYVAPDSFAMPKPPGVVRIFCLGGSATAGVPFGKGGSFPYFLGLVLNSADPYTRVEVINSAMAGATSGDMREITRELVRYDPDWILVYMGNNDFRVADSSQLPGSGERMRSSSRRLFNRLATYKLLKKTIDSIFNRPGQADADAVRDQAWIEARVDEMRARVESLSWSEDTRATVHGRYERNLAAIVEIARGEGAGVILSTVGSNLRDHPPCNLGLGRELMDRCHESMDCADVAGQAFDPARPDRAYARGCCALAGGDEASAQTHFRQALDHDSPPIRATSAINEIIRRVARHRQLLLVDVEAALARQAKDGLPGDEFFLDSVHFSVDGNVLVANTFGQALVGHGVAPASPGWRKLAQQRVLAHQSKMPDQYLAGAYYTTASTSAVTGRFLRAQRMVKMALKFHPSHTEALRLQADLEMIIKERVEDSRR